MDAGSGELLFRYLEAVFLTIPMSLIVLFAYRRAIDRQMRVSARGERETAAQGDRESIERAAASAATRTGRPDDEEELRKRLATIYGLAAFAASAVITTFDFLWNDLEVTPIRAFMLVYVHAWPIVPTLALLLVVPQRKALLGFAAYALAGMVMIGVWSLANLAFHPRGEISLVMNAVRFLGFLFTTAAFPYLVILATGNRRLRAVSAPALAALVLFAFATLAVERLFVTAYDYTWTARSGLADLGENGWFMVLSLPVGWLCWRLLQWLRQRFDHKDFSDVQLIVDAWWLIVVFDVCIQLSLSHGWWGFAGLSAFAAYRVVVSVGLWVWTARTASPTGSRLLLLRVFGFQQRTERLFDAVASRWRFVGTPTMIGGTDLAMRTLSLPRLVAFLGNRLGAEFLHGTAGLTERLRDIDEHRDPDGRFRIVELFCDDVSWHAALKPLLARTDAVLMDLRGFHRHNAGCDFELRQLVAGGQVKRTVFIVDETTDVALLQATLAEAAREASADPETLVASLHIERNAASDAGHERIHRSLRRIAGGMPDSIPAAH